MLTCSLAAPRHPRALLRPGPPTTAPPAATAPAATPSSSCSSRSSFAAAAAAAAVLVVRVGIPSPGAAAAARRHGVREADDLCEVAAEVGPDLAHLLEDGGRHERVQRRVVHLLDAERPRLPVRELLPFDELLAEVALAEAVQATPRRRRRRILARPLGARARDVGDDHARGRRERVAQRPRYRAVRVPAGAARLLHAAHELARHRVGLLEV
mmetsp:Transcript_16686/g.51262  ORF Transcript_16686/g.51262 Transcript_16686/m.51262 type:complete len:212 (+) Transcript_16686:1226-1861(+)